MKKINKQNKSALLLIFMCALVYFVAYVGRLSYSANIAMVTKYYTVGGILIDNGTAGIVGTCLFASYGVGQVINGLLCKRYNPKYSIVIALVGSSIMNVLVALTPREGFYFICIYWLFNGFLQSILWSSLIRLLRFNLPKNLLRTSVLIMSLPVSLGTFATYGISALFSAISLSFRWVFVFSAIIMFTVAMLWFLCLERIKQNCLKESAGDVNQQREETIKTEKEESVGVKAFVMLFCLLAIFAVVNNFVKDGVNTWMPKILEQKYFLDEAISTFLTLFLPLFSVFGAAVASLIYKRAKGYVLTCGILYGCSAVLILLVVLFLDLPLWIITLFCFMLVSMCMSGVNNVLTGLFPMTSPKNFNAGLIAGLIDGFCYVGSAITTYGLGSVSDNLGWDAVIYLLLFICGLMVCVCAVYTIIEKLKKRKI